MPENQTKENNQPPAARKKTSRLKVALIIVALLLALLVLKVILILTAKPAISVNYVAELNRVSKPADYDPNQNAASYYEKASAEYVERPEKFAAVHFYRPHWFGDANEAELEILRQWIEKNTTALDYFKMATQKQYLWVERHTKDNSLMSLKPLGPENSFDLFRIITLRAQLSALDGKFDRAVQDLLACWKMAAHHTNPNLLLLEQLRGMRKKEDVLKSAFMILDRCNLDSENLQIWRETWQEHFKNDQYTPGFQTEKLYYYDLIQRCFTDDGRLTWRAARGLVCPYCTPLWITIKDWLTGPSRREITELVNAIFDHDKTAIRQTPWQRHISGKASKLQMELVIREDSPFDFFIPSGKPGDYYHKLKAMQEALLTVIAVLRYKADYGNYPQNLEELVERGYLTKLPQDPFSDRPLVYKRLDDKLKLYSFGTDFEDNNGVPIIIDVSKSMPGVLGFHPQSLERLKDIVYWPVKRLEKTATTKKSKLK